MKTRRKKRLGPNSHKCSVQAFVRRVIITLTSLVPVFAAVVFLLVYLPLKDELEKSLVDNFKQLTYIRYVSLQNSMSCVLGGARGLSGSTATRDAIVDYKEGKINFNELASTTQLKYEDKASTLEYLLKAERFVDGDVIARYTAKDYSGKDCEVWSSLTRRKEGSTALCLVSGCECLAVRSPILSQEQIIGYDHLTFNLSAQIHALCTEKIKSELVSQSSFDDMIEGADILQGDDTFTLFCKNDVYYQAFDMQDNTHFVSRQEGVSLLETVYRLSSQTLLAGIGVLCGFTVIIYVLVIRFAKNELIYLEDSRRSLTEAVSEANIDPLTGATTRRFGEEFLTSAFECFEKGEPSPAIVLFDIDSLKHINDTHGHYAGDEVIRSVANAIQKNTRGGDVLLRWGGDEFIGIFSGLSHENVMPFTHKLLKSVSDLSLVIGKATINPTISIGVSYFKEEDRSFLEAINRADRAMYQSKSEGRNRAHER